MVHGSFQNLNQEEQMVCTYHLPPPSGEDKEKQHTRTHHGAEFIPTGELGTLTPHIPSGTGRSFLLTLSKHPQTRKSFQRKSNWGGQGQVVSH